MDRVHIDTDILSCYFKGDEYVVENFKRYLQQYQFIEISVITYYEIYGGLLSKNALKQLSAFEDFARENVILPLTETSARIASELYSSLRQKGKTVDDIDLLIAEIAIENELSIATNNESHFGRIPGIEIVNWKKVIHS